MGVGRCVRAVALRARASLRLETKINIFSLVFGGVLVGLSISSC